MIMRGNGFMQRRFGRRLESGESVAIVSELKFDLAPGERQLAERGRPASGTYRLPSRTSLCLAPASTITTESSADFVGATPDIPQGFVPIKGR
jgi:hypothetical protein